jgi:hypothetical protein
MNENRTITQLPAITTLSGTEVYSADKGATTGKISNNTLRTWVLTTPTITGNATITGNLTVQGTTFNLNSDGRLSVAGNDLIIENLTQNQDIIIRGLDGAVSVDLMTFDFSLQVINVPDDAAIAFGDSNDWVMAYDSGAATMGIVGITDGDDFQLGYNNAGPQTAFTVDAGNDRVDYTADLVFVAGGRYLVVSDTYAFQSLTFPNIGFYFDATKVALTARNNDAVAAQRDTVELGVSTAAAGSFLKVNTPTAGARHEINGDGNVTFSSPTDIGNQLMILDQNDVDEPFIDFQGATAADAVATISTLNNSGATTDHLQIFLNGVKAWIAVSTNNPT